MRPGLKRKLWKSGFVVWTVHQTMSWCEWPFPLDPLCKMGHNYSAIVEYMSLRIYKSVKKPLLYFVISSMLSLCVNSQAFTSDNFLEVYAKVINIPIKQINKMSKTFLHYSCSKVSLQIKCNQSGDYKLHALRVECLRLKLCPNSQDWDRHNRHCGPAINKIVT